MDAYVALLAFVLFMVATPGPANLIVMTGGTQKGVRGCLGFILGLVTGKMALNLAIGLGLGVVLNDQVWLQTLLKFVSGGYMIWLAVQSWTPKPKGESSQAFTFPKGVIVHPLNPKAWVMSLLAWSDFAPELGSIPEQFVLIIGSFAVVQLVFHTLWCGAGQVLGRAFNNSLKLSRALVLLTVAVVLAALVF
jgi:threonine/homoserine/homoserine lactone efflux protein